MADFNKDIEIDGKVTANEFVGSNKSGGVFNGVFDVSKNGNTFYDDYLSGAVVNLSLSSTKVIGSMCTVNILGGLIGTIDTSLSSKQTGDEISVSTLKINELTILYISDTDVRMVVRTFDIPQAPDTESPTTPVLTESNIGSTSFDLSWVSTDNVGIVGSRVYLGGVLNQTINTSTLNTTITGLTPETAYNVTVETFDLAGNVSALSSVLSVSTIAVPTISNPTTILPNLHIWVDGTDSSEMTLSGSNVTSINDKEGNFTFSNVNTEPVFSTDKIVFNETGILRSAVHSSLLNHGQDFHGFLIFKNNSATQASFIANAFDASNRFAIGMRNGELSAGTYNGSAFNCKSVVFTDEASYHKLEFKLISGVMTVLLDDVNLTNTNTVLTTVLPEFIIGGAGSGTPKAMDFKNFFVTSGEMTTQQRTDILAYISNEYSL